MIKKMILCAGLFITTQINAQIPAADQQNPILLKNGFRSVRFRARPFSGSALVSRPGSWPYLRAIVACLDGSCAPCREKKRCFSVCM